MAASRHDLLVLGGGITGLAAAHRLLKRRPDLDLRVVEAAERPGGKIATEHRGGFLIEAGPDCFLSRKARGLALCRELGLEEELVGRDPRHARTFVRRHGRLHHLPSGLSGMVPTDLTALENGSLLSPEGVARVAAERDLPPAPENGDESVADFLIRRLGFEAFESLVEPLMGGIYAGQADQLSLAATFPHLRRLELEHGSLLVGLRAAAPAPTPNAQPPFLSLAGGMGRLVEALVERIGAERLRLQSRVTAIAADGTGYRVHWQDPEGKHEAQARALIVTFPAYAAAPLLEALDPDIAPPLAAIPHASTALVTLAFDEGQVEHDLEGYGYVVPRAEGDTVLACTWTSRKWRGRAPEGQLLLRVFIGRYGEPDATALPDARLVSIAREELRSTLGITAEPTLETVQRWPRGMPQYTMGHRERVAAIRTRLAGWPGLLMAGAAFDGVGIPDCIAGGEEAAEAALATLGPRSPAKEPRR